MTNEARGSTPDPKGSTEAEIAAAFGGPAVLVNRMFATITRAGLRVAFTEQRAEASPLEFRAAVILSIQDAIALRDLLSRILDPIEAEIEKGQQVTVRTP